MKLQKLRTTFILILTLLFSIVSNGQEESKEWMEEIQLFQKEQNDHYINKKTSPLPRKARKQFSGHKFYPIDLNYVVEAKFVRIEKEDTIELQSSSGNTKYYLPYAKVLFSLNGEACELTVFQSFRLRENAAYANYLLIPFRDATSGNTSYGGGKYLDITIPDSDVITLNFNLAYNPYCAYAMGYNCTIPPAENTLKVAVKAGLMVPDNH